MRKIIYFFSLILFSYPSMLFAQWKIDSLETTQTFLHLKQLLQKDQFEKAAQVADSLQKIPTAQTEKNYLYGKLFHEFQQSEKAQQFLAQFIASKVETKDTLQLACADALYLIGRNEFFNSYQNSFFFLNRSFHIQQQLPAKDSLLYANTLNVLAILYEEAFSDYTTAEEYYLASMEIRKAVLGVNSLDYAKSLNNLGALNQAQGHYEKAIQFFNTSIAIKGKILQEDHSSYAYGLMNLANLYLVTGYYKKAEALYLQSKESFETSSVKQREKYAHLILNIGSFYSHIGLYRKAESYFLTAATEFKKISETNLYYGLSLLNLGYLDIAKEDKYLQSEKHFKTALAILDTNVSDNIEYRLMAISGLALLHKNQKEYNKAKKIWLDLLEDEKLKSHPIYLTDILLNLGQLYETLNEFEEAHSVYEEALVITNKYLKKDQGTQSGNNRSMGTISEVHVQTLHNISLLHRRKGEYQEETNQKLALFPLIRGQIDNALAFMSLEEQEKYFSDKVTSILEELQSSALHLKDTAYQNLQYDIEILKKGLQLLTERQTLEYVFKQLDPKALANYYDLLDIKNKLRKIYEQPINARENQEPLEDKKQQIEKSLARLSAKFRNEQSLTKFTHQTIKNKLSQKEAAIEFIHFNYRNPARTDSVFYAAAVLTPNANHVQFVPLFEEQQLLKIINGKNTNRNHLVSTIYAARGLTPKNQKNLSKQVYDLVWKPLDSLLTGVETVYFSLSGQLHRLNFNALPIAKNKILADKYNVIQLSSTRLLALETATNSGEKTAYVIGGVQYDPSVDTVAVKRLLLTQIAQSHYPFTIIKDTVKLNSSPSKKEEAITYASRSLPQQEWAYLQWTKEEAANINQLMTQTGYMVNYQSGINATEATFKEIGIHSKSPKIIHIATHGFFFPKPTDSLKNLTEEPIFKVSEHPMLRSGLILANANRVWKNATPLPDEEDGILTAYEISNMNLTNTDLVVLSACETGLGDIEGDEGVYGLQRAFKKAGVRHLIMSLWQVPDRETSLFMQTFYKNYLEKEMSVLTAFNATQKAMRTQFKNPYLWAGFVLME